jgi:hypothetical protein
VDGEALRGGLAALGHALRPAELGQLVRALGGGRALGAPELAAGLLDWPALQVSNASAGISSSLLGVVAHLNDTGSCVLALLSRAVEVGGRRWGGRDDRHHGVCATPTPA